MSSDRNRDSGVGCLEDFALLESSVGEGGQPFELRFCVVQLFFRQYGSIQKWLGYGQLFSSTSRAFSNLSHKSSRVAISFGLAPASTVSMKHLLLVDFEHPGLCLSKPIRQFSTELSLRGRLGRWFGRRLGLLSYWGSVGAGELSSVGRAATC